MAGNLKNRATDSEAASYVAEIERLEDEFETFAQSKKGEIGAKRKSISKQQKAIKDDAKKQGVQKAVIDAIVKSRRHERKAEDYRVRSKDEMDALDMEQREHARGIREALGEDFSGLPLGAAAVQREEGVRDETTQAVIDAVDADEEREKIERQKAEDAEAFDQGSNVAKLDPKKARANRKKAEASA